MTRNPKWVFEWKQELHRNSTPYELAKQKAIKLSGLLAF